MFVPLIAILKLIAIGSIKLIFLLFGMAFFPITALRFILGGATSMLMPTLDWMEQSSKIDSVRHQAVVDDLQALTDIQFSRKEARLLLWRLIKKMVVNTVTTTRSVVSRMKNRVASLFGR